MGGPTTYRVGISDRTEVYQPGTPHVGLSSHSSALPGPTSPGAAILAERQRLETSVAKLRAALADLLALSQVQVLLTPEREAILHRAERALADTAPPAGA